MPVGTNDGPAGGRGFAREPVAVFPVKKRARALKFVSCVAQTHAPDLGVHRGIEELVCDSEGRWVCLVSLWRAALTYDAEYESAIVFSSLHAHHTRCLSCMCCPLTDGECLAEILLLCPFFFGGRWAATRKK